jgi:hypothetical protein
MGCLVSRSTIISYTSQLESSKETLYDSKLACDLRKKQIPLEKLDFEGPIGYLAYQEQLREAELLKLLNGLFNTDDVIVPSDTAYLNTFENYVNLKFQQTELEEKLINKLMSIYEELSTLNRDKGISIEKQLQDLIERNNLQAEYQTKYLGSFQDLSPDINLQSFKNTIDSILLRSELDKEIELVQRKCEFKSFVSKKTEKDLKDAEHLEIKNKLEKDNESIYKKFEELKTSDVEMDNQINSTKNFIDNKEDIINKLLQEKEIARNALYNANEQDTEFNNALEKYKEKVRELREIETFINSLSEDLLKLKSQNNLNELKTENKILKATILSLSDQIDKLKAEKTQADILRQKNYKLIEKISIIDDLKQNIKFNQEKISIVEKDSTEKIKKQVIIRLIQSFKNLKILSFRTWKDCVVKLKFIASSTDNVPLKNSSLISIEEYKAAVPWKTDKLYDFIDELMKEKYLDDTGRLKNQKLPKAMDKFIKIYMKQIYKSTNETEREIHMMVKSLVMQENLNKIASIIKKMIKIDENELPYHIIVLITMAWNEFDNIKITYPSQDNAFASDIFAIIEDYAEDNEKAGQTLAKKINKKNIPEDEYILLMFKYKFGKLIKESMQYANNPEDFIELAINKLKLLAASSEIESFLNKYFDYQFANPVSNLSSMVQSLKIEDYLIKKSDFLVAIIKTFEEFKLKDIEALKEIIKDKQVLNQDTVDEILSDLGEPLTISSIQKIFFSETSDNSENSEDPEKIEEDSLDPSKFIEIILKYGISGYGVGPCKKTLMTSILQQFFNKQKSRTRKRKLSDIIPYKITIDLLKDKVQQLMPQKEIFEIVPSTNMRLPNTKKSRSSSPISLSPVATKSSVFFNSNRISSPRNSSPNSPRNILRPNSRNE